MRIRKGLSILIFSVLLIAVLPVASIVECEFPIIEKKTADFEPYYFIAFGETRTTGDFF